MCVVFCKGIEYFILFVVNFNNFKCKFVILYVLGDEGNEYCDVFIEMVE